MIQQPFWAGGISPLVMDNYTLNMKALHFSETSAIIYPTGFKVITAVLMKIKVLRDLKATSTS